MLKSSNSKTTLFWIQSQVKSKSKKKEKKEI